MRWGATPVPTRSGPAAERAQCRCSRSSSIGPRKTSREISADSGVVPVIARHHLPEQKRAEDSTDPLRFSRRGGQGSTIAPLCLATGARVGWMSRLSGVMTVARRSVGQMRAVEFGAVESAHHLVHRLNEVRLVHLLGEHPTDAP